MSISKYFSVSATAGKTPQEKNRVYLPHAQTDEDIVFLDSTPDDSGRAVSTCAAVVGTGGIQSISSRSPLLEEQIDSDKPDATILNALIGLPKLEFDVVEFPGAEETADLAEDLDANDDDDTVVASEAADARSDTLNQRNIIGLCIVNVSGCEVLLPVTLDGLVEGAWKAVDARLQEGTNSGIHPPTASTHNNSAIKNDDEIVILDSDDDELRSPGKSARKGRSKLAGLGSPRLPLRITPLQQQLIAFKRQHSGCIIFLQCGYRFVALGSDAVVTARELGMYCGVGFPFCQASFPVSRISTHTRRMARLGHKVAVIRQTETAAVKKEKGRAGRGGGRVGEPLDAVSCPSDEPDFLKSTPDNTTTTATATHTNDTVGRPQQMSGAGTKKERASGDAKTTSLFERGVSEIVTACTAFLQGHAATADETTNDDTAPIIAAIHVSGGKNTEIEVVWLDCAALTLERRVVDNDGFSPQHLTLLDRMVTISPKEIVLSVSAAAHPIVKYALDMYVGQCGYVVTAAGEMHPREAAILAELYSDAKNPHVTPRLNGWATGSWSFVDYVSCGRVQQSEGTAVQSGHSGMAGSLDRTKRHGVPIRIDTVDTTATASAPPVNNAHGTLRTYLSQFGLDGAIESCRIFDGDSGDAASLGTEHAVLAGSVISDCDVIRPVNNSSLVELLMQAGRAAKFRPSSQCRQVLQRWLQQPLRDAVRIQARQEAVTAFLRCTDDHQQLAKAFVDIIDEANKPLMIGADDESSKHTARLSLGAHAWSMITSQRQAQAHDRISSVRRVLTWLGRLRSQVLKAHLRYERVDEDRSTARDEPALLLTHLHQLHQALVHAQRLDMESDLGMAPPTASPTSAMSPPLTLAEHVVAQLIPDYSSWAARLGAAEAVLEGELSDVRRVLKLPGLQWKTLRTGPTTYIEYVIELETSRITSPLFPIKIPDTWKELGSTTKCRRFHTPAVIAASHERAYSLDMMTSCRSLAWRKWSQTRLAEWITLCVSPIMQNLVQVEALFVLSKYAALPDMCLPYIHSDPLQTSIHAEAARHPLLAARLGPQCMPSDIRLGLRCSCSEAQCDPTSPPSSLCTVVTGPNAGGKSTMLRTMLTLTLLAQMGSYVPAARFCCTPFGVIGSWMQKADSLQFGISSFGAEIYNIKEALKYSGCAARALLVFDEPVSATDAAHGAALACSVVQTFIDSQQKQLEECLPPCLLVLSTHYRAAAYCASFPSLANYHMGYLEAEKGEGGEGETTVVMLYKLVPGVTSSSLGLKVAAAVGMPPEIIKHARKLLEHGEPM